MVSSIRFYEMVPHVASIYMSWRLVDIHSLNWDIQVKITLIGIWKVQKKKGIVHV